MVLQLKILNSDCTLNNFQESSSFQMVRGSDATIRLQLFQADKKIRYVPVSGATITFSILKSDGTSLSKTASFPFADDRSIISITISASESATLISQNLAATIVESGNTTYAVLQQGLQVINLSSGC